METSSRAPVHTAAPGLLRVHRGGEELFARRKGSLCLRPLWMHLWPPPSGTLWYRPYRSYGYGYRPYSCVTSHEYDGCPEGGEPFTHGSSCTHAWGWIDGTLAILSTCRAAGIGGCAGKPRVEDRMTDPEAKKIIKLLERISNQLSTIREDVAYVVSREKARDQRQDEEVKKLLEQSRIGISAGKK